MNPDVAARSARERAREAYPELVARYERNLVLAEAALVERERRKQGPPPEKHHAGSSGRAENCTHLKNWALSNLILCSHDSVTEAIEKENGGIRFASYGAMMSPFNMTIPSLFWGYFGQFREAHEPVVG